MGQPCNQESSIKLTHPPCTTIYTGNCPTPAAAVENQASPETRRGVNTATNGKRFKQGGKRFSPMDYVKAQYLVSVSEGGVAAHWVPRSERRGSNCRSRSTDLSSWSRRKKGWISTVCSKLFSAYAFIIAKIRHPKCLLIMQNVELGMCCPLYIKVIDFFL